MGVSLAIITPETIDLTLLFLFKILKIQGGGAPLTAPPEYAPADTEFIFAQLRCQLKVWK